MSRHTGPIGNFLSASGVINKYTFNPKYFAASYAVRVRWARLKVADFMSEIAQRSNNPPVTPGTILFGKLEHQIFDRLVLRVMLYG
jgi:hypothetical protein